jgi:hypothetical protein
MIQTEQRNVYSAECDVCKADFEDPFEGWTVFLNQDHMLDRMDTADWHIGDNVCYCPKCYKIDDEDNLIIKTETL